MAYNPYDLVPLLINGKEMQGRPFEFDSDVADNAAMTNSFGNYVKPTKISTCCPDCGDGMEVEVNLNDPPFDPVVLNCQQCNPGMPEVVDPFMNPVDSDRVAEHELDPLLHNPDEQIKTDESTVADRIGQPEGSGDSDSEDVDGHATQAVLVKDQEGEEAQEASGENPEENADTGEVQEEAPVKPEDAIESDEGGDKPTAAEASEEPKEKPEDPPEEPEEVIEEPKKATKKTSKKSTAKKTTKKAPKKSSKKTEDKPKPEEKETPKVEPADGITEEEDIDDDEEVGDLGDLLDQLEEDDE